MYVFFYFCDISILKYLNIYTCLKRSVSFLNNIRRSTDTLMYNVESSRFVLVYLFVLFRKVVSNHENSQGKLACS